VRRHDLPSPSDARAPPPPRRGLSPLVTFAAGFVVLLVLLWVSPAPPPGAEGERPGALATVPVAAVVALLVAAAHARLRARPRRRHLP
jgi:hypothetical protein